MSNAIVTPAIIASILSLAVTGIACAETKKKPSSSTAKEFRVSLFSGNESRIGQLGYLKPDCSSSTPDIRIVKQPSNGALRMQEGQLVASAKNSAIQKKCYGKTTNTLQIFYRANESFSGSDTVVLDVDSKLGTILHYTYKIDVRRKSAAEPAKDLAEIKVSRSVLTGNEARIAAMNYVNVDCTSGPVPDLRIVVPPKNGAYRLEQQSIQVDRKEGQPRANCNGKPVDAMAVLYKPNEAFTGGDGLTVDVDFRNGTVRRYVYDITVR